MRTSFIVTGWAVTLAAAFLLGRQSSPQTSQDVSLKTEAALASPTPVTTPPLVAAPEPTTALDAKVVEAAVAFVPVVANDGAADGADAEKKIASLSDANTVIRLKDSVDRARAFARLRDGMTKDNAQQILAMFLAKGFETTREQEEIRMLAEKWASVDGKGAVEYLNSMDHDQRPDNTLRSSLAEWAMKDTDAAEAWARGATTNQPNHYMIGIIAGTANVDLSRAERLLYEMPYGRTRGEAMAYVAGAHLERGDSDAMNWATTVPDPRLEMAAIRKVAAQVALSDPQLAANWVVKNSNEEQMQYNVGEIAKQWSYAAPEAAANWAFALPAGPARDSAVMATLPALAQQQPALVEKMLLNYPPTKATDPARLQLVRNYSNKDPIRALAWANTVTDKQTKDHVTQRIVENWAKTDPQGAAAFLQPKVQ